MTYIKNCYEKFINSNELDHMYRNHTSHFVDYIENVAHLGDRIVDIHSIHLRESLLYNIREKKNIKTVSTMNNYLNALKLFFSYLKKIGMAENIFNEIPDYNVFRDEIINECNLKQTVARGCLDDDVIDGLLYHFNNDQKQYANMKMIGFFFKITLIAPAKRKVIANLKISDFSEEYKSVTVNNITVRLPRALSNDIQKSINALNRDISDNELFFSLFYSGKYNDNVFNMPFYYALKKIGYDVPKKKDTFPVEDIQNTGLVNLIESGADILMVARIAGISETSLLQKLERFGIKYYDEDKISGLYNKEISRVRYYQEL